MQQQSFNMSEPISYKIYMPYHFEPPCINLWAPLDPPIQGTHTRLLSGDSCKLRKGGGERRRKRNSRMRLAKGFFLPLIAAEMGLDFCRPASGGRPVDVGRRFSERRFIDINSFFTHLLIHAPTQPPTLPPILLLTHSRTHSFNPYRTNYTPIQSFSNSLFEPPTRSSNQSINHLLILTINYFLINQPINYSSTQSPT